jgi:hypothetical protein
MQKHELRSFRKIDEMKLCKATNSRDIDELKLCTVHKAKISCELEACKQKAPLTWIN